MEKITRVPKHLGVIMDGNRRFAKAKGLPGWAGHEYGIVTFHKFLDWVKEFGVKETTFYTFSTENFNRPKREKEQLFKHFREEMDDFRHDKRIKRDKVRVKFVGRLWMFPEDIQQMMYDFMEETKKHKNYTINFAMAYGGRSELIDCMKDLLEEASSGTLGPADLDEKLISERLLLGDMDMVIRTGGVSRTSNFFPWQTAYAEWFFLKKMWPAVTKRDFFKCLVEYGKRERRMGK